MIQVKYTLFNVPEHKADKIVNANIMHIPSAWAKINIATWDIVRNIVWLDCHRITLEEYDKSIKHITISRSK